MTYLGLDLFSDRVFFPDRGKESFVDSFAGGGGTSEGVEMALGRSPDFAINHDPEAVAMHIANHPGTEHFCQNVWQVNPNDIAARGPIGAAWFSPDCKHFSKAKGGKPREKNIRDLAWIVIAYAKLPRHLRPRVIFLENVEEFRTWGPLDPEGQPDNARKGETFTHWMGELKRLGYRVQWRELRACDYGAPTIRKRLFLIARCDQRPIVWPEPTHGAPDSPEVVSGQRSPWRNAADIIDWSLSCPSIFLTPEEARAIGVKRPLAEATMRRIFAGLRRYVIDNPRPFIVSVAHGDSGGRREYPIDDPLGTVTSGGISHALVAPYVSRQFGASVGHAVSDPLATTTAGGGGKSMLVTPFVTKFNTGSVGSSCTEPLHTITCSHSEHHPGGAAPIGIVAAYLSQLHGSNRGNAGDMDAPLGAVLAGGLHHAEVRAFLVKYYGDGGQTQDCREPLHTIPTRDRFGVVTVKGQDYAIVDIGMRMLSPRELFRAQGFPDDYKIDIEFNGRPLSKSAQVRLCGNSVCPPMAAALVGANVPELARAKESVHG